MMDNSRKFEAFLVLVYLLESRMVFGLMDERVCIGTNGRMSVPSNRDHHYRNLKDRYTNCTYVDGNLELTWIQDENLDLNFLQYIREVTGYVLISHVDIKSIVLPRLQIIRGRTLFKIAMSEQEFALLVTQSKMFSLELPSLRDVLNGSVGMISNYNLCHIKTIEWKEIISHANGSYVYNYTFNSPERECPPCHKNCQRGCWGEGEENCQKFSKLYCSPQCYQGRCFGPNPRECCHLFCAGGCTGPTQADCIACKNFYDDGVCTADCPSMQVYNPITYSWEPNPNGKYAYGATCVKNCPEHLLKDNGACVRSCPSNKTAVNGECVNCDGPCPKTCAGGVLVDSGNIDTFKDCTIIDGHLHILENSIKGYQHIFSNYSFGARYPPMHPDRLEVFSTLREVTGFINIQAYHEDFKNLSYFRNLEIIGGRTLHDFFSSLFIVKTSLRSMELRSLKRINSGNVVILENKNLCFAETIDWSKIKKSSDQPPLIQSNGANCSAKGLICDEECTDLGCWGAGPENCLSCAHVKFESTCLWNCSVKPGLYHSEKNECKRCNEQCASSCHGSAADKCTECKHVKDGNFCVETCPTGKFPEFGVCKPCHPTCNGDCTGPSNIVGPGGCNLCYKGIVNTSVTECIDESDDCPDGYYLELVNPKEHQAKTSNGNCRKCHPRCKKCTSYGFHIAACQQCANYKKDELCEDECPRDHYPDDENHECLPCDRECKGCTGPGPDLCIACENLKLYEGGDPTNNLTFKCVSSCPPEYPFRVFPQDSSESYCSKEPEQQSIGALVNSSTPIILTVVIVIISLFVVVICLVTYYWCRKVQDKEDALKMTMALTGLENEPLQPSKVLPNLAKLRIIKEAEMRKGGILGYGAFGTVYKGVWLYESENNKIPVAIKVLREDAGINTSKEFLSEAYIMASVDHPNLLQLLGVCMTTQMMLVTQLMPLGCLLDFVRKNRDKICAKPLLTWCTQIARGMAYLEEKRLVHRDLAARNVLVQTPACIKITDFGLAKLLDINEEEYKAAGGKMPIKWLALECIQHRIFTHKSDVWAFGVTVWELLSFGERPYESVSARDVPELLESGERLPQPSICSIEVYMLMLKCWMLDAESRPGFKELSDDFMKMSKDPERYLAISGETKNNFQNHEDVIPRRRNNPVTNSSSHSGENDMQPQQFPLHISTSGSPQMTSMKFWPYNSHMTSDGSCAPQNQHNWNQERLLAQSRLDPNQLRNINSDDSSIHYCGDSLKYKSYNVGSDEYDSASGQAQVGTLKLELPVDEDDYLVPSPQQNQNASTYVDLIGDSKGSDELNPNIYKSYSDFTKTNIDNPEYLLSSETPTQTLGIPTVSNLVHAITRAENNAKSAQPYMPQRSTEEESDHEYYNDFDRLRRELQPLKQKGETTV